MLPDVEKGNNLVLTRLDPSGNTDHNLGCGIAAGQACCCLRRKRNGETLYTTKTQGLPDFFNTKRAKMPDK